MVEQMQEAAEKWPNPKRLDQSPPELKKMSRK